MNDLDKTASNPLPRQWSLTTVTLAIPGIGIGGAIGGGAIGAGIGGDIFLGGSLGLIVLGGVVAFGGRWRHAMLKWGIGMIVFGLALIHGGFNANPSRHGVSPITERHIVEMVGTVATAEAMTKGRQRIRFTPDKADNPDNSDNADNAGKADNADDADNKPLGSGDWRLILPKRFVAVLPGDRIRITARIAPPLPRLLPGGFDFTAHAVRKGFSASGFISELEVIGHGAASPVAVLRAGIQARLSHHLGADEAAVASALLVGLRGLIPPDLREKFRASGLAHLLAISGLHMALFCGGVVFLLRGVLALMPGFSSRYPALKIAAVVALPTGAGYLLLAGMPISAIRAFGMMVLLILAILMDRRGLTLHHVALMALFLLVVDPAALNDPAFQMSFAAVFALVAGWFLLQGLRLKRAHYPDPSPMGRLGRYVGGIMMASVLASTASMPFVLHHFGVTTAWSVLANIIGMPLMAFVVMPAGALALALMPLGLEAAALLPMEAGLRLLISLAALIEGLPFSAWSLPPPSGEVLLLLTLAALLPFTVPRRWRAVSPALLMAAIFVWYMTPLPKAAVIALHGRTYAMVIDAAGEAVASSQGNDFATGILRRPFGVNAAVAVDDSGHDCREGYCLIAMDGDGDEGKHAAFVFARHALTPACREADLIIAFVKALYPCRSGAMLIDRRRLEAEGGALIYESGGVLTAEHVNPATER